MTILEQRDTVMTLAGCERGDMCIRADSKREDDECGNLSSVRPADA